MDAPQPDLAFRFMALMYRFRDLIRPRMDILREVGIELGSCVLDYGCGPGGYVAAAAELVGNTGKVYALDIHPLAVSMVRGIASREHLANVETILSDCETGLPDTIVDVVLLYDTFHNLSEPDGILAELYRVMKPDGILSFSDHHMTDEDIVTSVTGSGLFRLSRKGERTFLFAKNG